MEIGIGLPNAVAGTTGEQLIEFARRADRKGFSSLGALDRIVYDNHESLVALAAAAAVTERIGLATTILIAPYRSNAALIAKQAASVQALSGGRLTLGIAVGRREDDYEVSGVPMAGRGELFERQLELIERIWAGEEFGTAGAIGPRVDPPPSMIVGGQIEATFRRAARHGDGWIMGGGTPEQFSEGAKAMREAWSEAGREGEPRLAALAYFALGEGAEEAAKEDLEHYYAWLGEELAQMIASSAATSAEMVQQYVGAFERVGCNELFLFPTSSDPAQVDLLADALGM